MYAYNVYSILYIYLFWVNVFIVGISNQNEKEKNESNANLKNQGIMIVLEVWDSGLEGLHFPMVG